MIECSATDYTGGGQRGRGWTAVKLILDVIPDDLFSKTSDASVCGMTSPCF